MKNGDSPELLGFHQSMRGEHGFEPVRVEGELPDVLRGTLYRNGPALFEHGGRRHRHSFEGDGAVCAVRFTEEEVECAHKLVESEELLEERAAGRALYGTAAPWFRRFRNGLKRRFKNSANTSVWQWQERMFALMERGPPTEIDPHTLGTIGTTTLDGLIVEGFSAHPHRVRPRRADYNFGMVPGRVPYIQLIELPWEGAPRVITKLELEANVMLHDFIVTESHLVLFIAPVRLQKLRYLLGSKDLEKIFRFESAAGTEIIIVPLNEPEKPVRFNVDAFWLWHFAGAYETSDGIVADFVRHPDFRSLGELDNEERSGLGRLTRAHLDPKSKTMRVEELWDHRCEFPRIDPRFEGERFSKVFLSSDSGEHLLAKVDVDTGEVDAHILAPTEFPSEIVMVPRSARAPEGDGYALSLIYDKTVDSSHIAVLDTSRMADGPIARVHLGHHVPMTFHGIWVPNEA